MFDWGLYLALIIALGIGFIVGYRQSQKDKKPSSSSLKGIDRHYFTGLNFLLNEQPDAAIDAFIQALEVNSETLETHLALGNLLRKRGEVDRAIRIHQNLLARPGLTLHQAQQAQYELATDFVKSGLFDRAEGLLEELVTKEGPYKILGLKRLLEVYRDEKEWQSGLTVLQKLSGSRFSKAYEEWAPIRAHFYCELAELSIAKQQYDEARQWLKKALSDHKHNIRAGLLLGRLEVSIGNSHKAIAQLQKVITFDTHYVAEVIPYLTEAYQQLGDIRAYRSFLEPLVGSHPHEESVLIALADAIEYQDGAKAAAEYVAQAVIQQPSRMGLHKLLDYYLQLSEGNTQQHLQSLKVVMEQVVSDSTHYQCEKCGFKGHSLHWLCPTCKTWGSMQPHRHYQL